MQAYDYRDGAIGPIGDFEPGRLHELLGREDVAHVRVFKRDPAKAKKVAKNRQRKKAAKKMRAKQRKK